MENSPKNNTVFVDSNGNYLTKGLCEKAKASLESHSPYVKGTITAHYDHVDNCIMFFSHVSSRYSIANHLELNA